MKIIVKTLIAAGIGAAAALPAWAGEEVTTSGSVIYTPLAQTEINHPWVRLITAGTLQGSMPNDPFHDLHQACTGLFAAGTAGLQAQRGTCTAIDNNGDMWSLAWKAKEDGSGNTWHVIWGSGKYEGMTGKGTTVNEPVGEEGQVSVTWEGKVKMK